MLASYRVLDLTDERGQLAGEMLRVLGADVVLVEPPEGSAVRRLAPFAGTAPDRDRSLTFWGWNRGKRSVTIDLGSPAGQDELARLAGEADVLIESGAVPVNLEHLRDANPALVTVSISAYGTTGPKAHWPATDLTVLAAGGQLVLTGDADRAPVRTTIPQAFLHAAGDAACGALFALTERANSGLGQHVDISAQRAVLFATQSHVLSQSLGASLTFRMSGGQRVGALDVQFVWPCKDGHVSITLLFGPSFGPYTERFMAWICEEGHCDEDTSAQDWIGYGERLFAGKLPLDDYAHVKDAVTSFCATRTKEELLDGAVARRLLIAPVATLQEVVESTQFQARGYWDEVHDPRLAAAPITAPGAFVQPSAGALPALGGAPGLGEHTGAPWRDNGAARAAQAPDSGDRRAPLEGLKVLDLTWALTGPATARSLAEFGATVVHVESGNRPDAARTVQPFVNDEVGLENAGVYLNMNVGKFGLSLNLAGPEGRAVLDDLVRWADVLIESFSPRGRRSLGLDYQRLVTLNPRLIMFSSTLFGQYGPLETYAGFGTMGAALSGFFHLTGWPDRAPAGPFAAYTDYVSPRFAISTLLAALDHRRRTGEGQYLDFAQAESAVHFLTPAVLDYTVNGRVANREGNDDPAMAPHGVYRCAGDDRWVAIACRDDDDWRALAKVLGRPDLADLDSGERLTRRRQLDAMVEEWTSTRPPEAAEAELINRGVPAHGVQHSPECTADPQLRHVGHLAEVAHPHHGVVTVETSRLALSATPASARWAGPVLGEHTSDVLARILGYDDDRIGELYGAGALD